jgi:dTDP-4-dehydrorhamnose 3,5-epimerase
MKFTKSSIPDCYIVGLDLREDSRGFFSRTFCEEEFRQRGLNTKWSQCNLSSTSLKGTLRGLHIQLGESSEVKLVRCVRGAIWDVVVDLRVTSKSLGKWFGLELSSANKQALYVPRGFAHGFVTLTDDVEVHYMVSEAYAPGAERTLVWNDPDVAVRWPIPIGTVSEKDSKGLNFKKLCGLSVEVGE